MKFSAALALAAAPAALGKAINNVFPAINARTNHQSPAQSPAQGQAGSIGQIIGEAAGAGTQVIVIWANPGGAAATTTINQAVTVTQTVTAGAPAATGVAPPGAIPTHHVTVGGAAGLVFTPPQIQAAVGDMVVFTFLSKNHTATQSSFAKPCEPLAGGQASGFQPNPDDSIVPAPQVAMQVMTTEPLWFYCAQANHCGQGMVFSVNPTAEKTQAAFQAAAIKQKGTGQASPITGGAPAGGAAGNGTTPATPVQSGSPSVVAPGGNIQTGVGQIQNGQCVCAVTCSSAQFPAAGLQGRGAFGGFPGALPKAMMETQ